MDTSDSDKGNGKMKKKQSHQCSKELILLKDDCVFAIRENQANEKMLETIFKGFREKANHNSS